jgi:hypothetical protein
MDVPTKIYIDLRLEFLDWLYRANGRNYLSAANLLTLDTTEKGTHVITCFGLEMEISSHFEKNRRRRIRGQAPCGTSLRYN